MSHIRAFLSQSTAHLHEKVDRAFSLDRITDPAGYRAMLLSHAAIVPAAERFVNESGHLADLPDASARSRTHSLSRDIDALGLAAPAEAHMSFLNSRGGVAGIVYVLEGSRLGATVIRRRLAQSGAGFPVSFLSHGEGSGFWASFLNWLQGVQWSAEDLDDMRHNAIELFQHYLKTAEALLPSHEPDRTPAG